MDAKSLALHTQAVLQGAFILAKGKDDAAIAIDSIAHLRRYFELLFNTRPSQAKRQCRPTLHSRRQAASRFIPPPSPRARRIRTRSTRWRSEATQGRGSPLPTAVRLPT